MDPRCLFCAGRLGRNPLLATLPIGERIAFDPARGRLWVICPGCERWNLVPIEERWEAVEACERLFRGTRLRFSTAHVGLGYLVAGLALVRIGPALKPELAAWRYGRYLRRWLPAARAGPWREAGRAVSDLADWGTGVLAARLGVRRNYDLAMWLRLKHRPNRVIAVAAHDTGRPLVIRARHLETTELIRPDPGQGWRLAVAHDGGRATIGGDPGLALAGRILARLNGGGAPEPVVRYAVTKLDDAANPEGYFARVAAIAMRYWWGRRPNEAPDLTTADPEVTEAERVALQLTKRSFWGRGGFGSEPATPLPRLPLVDRLALEMAANEDAERRAMEGELARLEAAWREAEELAAISDNLLFTPSAALPPAGAWPIPS
jgi:hypothetical protein